MSQPSSVSNPCAGTWGYIRPGLGRTGRSLSENNFAKERRDWLSILLREIFQNALDAKSASANCVEVTLKNKELSEQAASFISGLIPASHLERYNASVPHLQQALPAPVTSCLVVEDFGTSGLTGDLDNPELDGTGQNWNAFWFREGEGGKEHGSGNGGAGQGKITYFSTSGIRTIFGYTVRQDHMDEALFGASSFLRDYEYEAHKWKRDAYWGAWAGTSPDERVAPLQIGDTIVKFRQYLGLQRTPEHSGLSLIIPSAKAIDIDQAIRITIAEFFVPIYRGDLIVTIDDIRIERTSIVALADSYLTDVQARGLHTCTTKGYRKFLEQAIDRSKNDDVFVAKVVTAANQLTEANFDEDALKTMREAYQNEVAIAVRFPVMVKPRSGPAITCHFDVHLLCPFDLDQPEQAVIRRDLLIGEEPVGGGKLRQRVRGLTLIKDRELSKLLLSAEEATHLRWNTKLPRLSEYYKAGETVVAIVRNAMVKFLDVLTEGDQKRDFRLLAKYFSAPGGTPIAQTKGKKTPDGKHPKVPGDIPPPKPKLLAIDPLADGCRIRPAKADALQSAKLPLRVTAEFAYEGLDKDAFSEYDPLDFDLRDATFSIKGSGYSIVEKTLNELIFLIENPDFVMTIGGFDQNLRLRMRLNYKEAQDAETVDAE